MSGIFFDVVHYVIETSFSFTQLISFASLALGIYAKVGKRDYYAVTAEISPSYHDASIHMIAIGVLNVLLVFIGLGAIFTQRYSIASPVRKDIDIC